MAALPKENMEIRTKYRDDPSAMNFVGGFINQENALLSRQAAEIAKKLPAGIVSAAEYYAIAVAMQNSYDLAAAGEFLKYSIDSAKDFNTEIAAVRSTANLHFVQGRPEAGRVEYQKALNIFSKYDGYDAFTKASTHIWTELAWAASEAGAGQGALAKQHVENASELTTGLAPGPGTEQLKGQVAQARAQFNSGAPIAPSLAAGPALGTPAVLPGGRK